MKNNLTNQKILRVGFMVSVFLVALCGIVWASSGGEAHEGAHHVNHWIANDTWKTSNFCILAIALFLLAKKPVAQFFSSRAKGIEDEINDLERRKAVAEKKLAEYQARFRNLDQESKKILEDYIKQGEEAKARIIREAEAQAEKLLERQEAFETLKNTYMALMKKKEEKLKQKQKTQLLPGFLR